MSFVAHRDVLVSGDLHNISGLIIIISKISSLKSVDSVHKLDNFCSKSMHRGLDRLLL